MIEVGPENRKYHVHKALIVYHSEFFNGAFNGTTKEADEGLIHMEDIDPSSGTFSALAPTYNKLTSSTVNIFVHWLYTQGIPRFENKTHWDSILEYPKNKASSKHVLTLLKAYVFGDRIIAPAFRLAMNNAIADYYPIAIETPEPIVAIVQYAFDNIPPDRVVLMLLVNDFCQHWKEKLDKNNETLKLFPQQFVFRVMRRLSVIYHMTPEERAKNYCAHEHKSEEMRKRCRDLHMVFDKERDYGHFV